MEADRRLLSRHETKPAAAAAAAATAAAVSGAGTTAAIPVTVSPILINIPRIY